MTILNLFFFKIVLYFQLTFCSEFTKLEDVYLAWCLVKLPSCRKADGAILLCLFVWALMQVCMTL